MPLLVEHLYRGHEILTIRSLGGMPPWYASVFFGDDLLFQVAATTEAAALYEARQRVDLMLDKPK